jgi:LuxR family maltose regulon positive regulatory protein
LADAPASGILHVALAELLCEKNELGQAEDHLVQGLDLSQLGGHHDYLRNARIVMAHLRLAQGDAPGALEAIQKAQQITPQAEMPLPSAELAAHKARVWIAQQNLFSAACWAREACQRPGQDRGYTRQVEAATIARVRLAQGKWAQALDQLITCQRMAREGSARRWRVEIEILRALAQQARGNQADALTSLRRALSLAEPAGYIQLFVDEGPPMTSLLTTLFSKVRGAAATDPPGVSPAYIRQLLDALERAAGSNEPVQPAMPRPLIEPLTERENEVLALMALGLSNRQIADQLTIAIGTVKAHLHSIYEKLGVHGRMQAAARARDLCLL